MPRIKWAKVGKPIAAHEFCKRLITLNLSLKNPEKCCYGDICRTGKDRVFVWLWVVRDQVFRQRYMQVKHDATLQDPSALCDDLRHGWLGKHVRLDQEYINFAHVKEVADKHR